MDISTHKELIRKRAVFDQGNASTSLHPAFIFSKLNNTGKLVYILEQSVAAYYMHLLYPNPYLGVDDYIKSVDKLHSTYEKYVNPNDPYHRELSAYLGSFPDVKGKDIGSLFDSFTENHVDLGLPREVYCPAGNALSLIMDSINLYKGESQRVDVDTSDPSRTSTRDYFGFFTPLELLGEDTESNKFSYFSFSFYGVGNVVTHVQTYSSLVLDIVARAVKAGSIKSFDTLIGVLSCFKVGSYLLKRDKCTFAIEDIAYASTMGEVNKVTINKVISQSTLNEFYQFLRDVSPYMDLSDIKSTSLINFLELVGVDNDILGYLTKDIKLITAKESLAFSSSQLNFLPDRLDRSKLVMAMEENSDTEDEVDPLTPIVDEEGTEIEDTPDDTDDLEGMDQDDTLPDEEDEETPREKKAAYQLIELANDKITLPEYMYRKLVLERLIMVVKNPPANIPRLEIVLIKKWISHWINLVSISSLKDYISRLSFRLMDTLPAEGGEKLNLDKVTDTP